MSDIIGTTSPAISPTTSTSGLPTLQDGFLLSLARNGSNNTQNSPGNGMGSTSLDSALRKDSVGVPNQERSQSRGSDTDVQMSGHSHNNGNGDRSGSLVSPTTSRKRQSVDGVEYPRRRATIACEVCRSRKSRCDGSRPKCRLCIELNAECIYREPGIKLDAGDKLILEHLSRIENLLQNALPSPSHSHHGASPTVSAATGLSDEILMKSTLNLAAINGQQIGQGTWNNTNISSMPKVHSTPALNLLQWPKISQLVSRPYGPQHLLQLELSRAPLQLNSSLTLDLSNTSAYVSAYFERVNVWYACVNPYNWTSYYRTALSQGFRSGAESCIVLLVLALGNASTRGSISRISPDEDPPGMSYFSTAWGLLPSLMTRTTMMSAQCMILSAAYLFYIVRPLEAWTLLSSTSMKLQLLLSTNPPAMLPTADRELSERVDLLAELDLPHSGIVQFEESVGLPCGFEEEDEEPVVGGRDDLWYFLAEIALRRLLNRVSHLIYSKGTSTSITSLAPVVAELDYQLTQWYESLPIPVQFPHSRVLLSNPVQTVLRLRYFACRTIIFRPYILAVLENEKLGMDVTVRENCRKALEACIRQLEHITEHHAGHMPYLWQGALSMVSQSLLVMGATMSQNLASLLPPAEQMDIMFQDVIAEVERYAHLAPSLRLSAEIIREAEDRRQIYLRNHNMRM
ncbi:Similar to Nitrogen assimilation transcription factor nit-4; acc. no. P28349 [Pyronema omphalodes CBS 100304]|uniref:Similar to Nitrogen assimilation transcription factor nit-4 acc. no. P28349 n=1 Tax=Pyronema omphalodes (strain CBS 100304) TaxID=1076935 RepID=U4LU53_PYROM|nr:Similar to Nitrogen assimilation transcription factor nit-4; acc. no. P28349 [Pyronema omphalodes CBS 100304]